MAPRSYWIGDVEVVENFDPAGESDADIAVHNADAAAHSNLPYVPQAQSPTISTNTTIQAITELTHNVDWRWTLAASGTFTGNSQTFTDPVMHIGWNVTAGAAKIDSAQWAWHLSLEYDYWTNVGYDAAWHHQPEAHLQFQAVDGTVIRVWSADVNTSLKKSAFTITADYFNVTTTGGVQMITFSSSTTMTFNTSVAMNATAPGLALNASGGDANLYLNPSSGQQGRLHFQRGASERWQIINNASDNVQFYDVVNNRVPVTLVPGNSATAARMDLLSILKFAHSSLFQTTVGAAGAGSALPATPTKYLKVLDDGGTTYVVPCYAAS